MMAARLKENLRVAPGRLSSRRGRRPDQTVVMRRLQNFAGISVRNATTIQPFCARTGEASPTGERRYSFPPYRFLPYPIGRMESAISKAYSLSFDYESERVDSIGQPRLVSYRVSRTVEDFLCIKIPRSPSVPDAAGQRRIFLPEAEALQLWANPTAEIRADKGVALLLDTRKYSSHGPGKLDTDGRQCEPVSEKKKGASAVIAIRRRRPVCAGSPLLPSRQLRCAPPKSSTPPLSMVTMEKGRIVS